MDSELSEVILAWHAASLDSEKWPDALTTLAEFLGAVDTTLEVHCGPGTRPDFFAGGNRLPRDGIRAYLEHYSSVCPRIAYIGAQPPGSVGFDHDFISEDEMDRNEFYADFLAPDDLRYFLSATLLQRSNAITAFAAVHRSPRQGHATPHDVERLKSVLPHMSQALDTHLRLGAQLHREASLLETLDRLDTGVILLDANGAVLHANATAEEMAEASDGLSLSGNGLAIDDGGAREIFHEILAGFLSETLDAPLRSGGDVVVPRPSGRPSFALHIRRLSPSPVTMAEMSSVPAAIVFMHDPGRGKLLSTNYLGDAFGLTRREAELAMDLYIGKDLRAHAAERGVRMSTVRYHLYHAMAKMGVRHQADMLRLLGQLIPHHD